MLILGLLAAFIGFLCYAALRTTNTRHRSVLFIVGVISVVIGYMLLLGDFSTRFGGT